MTGCSLAAAPREASSQLGAAISPLGRYLTDPGAVTGQIARTDSLS